MKLNKEQVERLLSVGAYGPCVRKAGDEVLEADGWLEAYDDASVDMVEGGADRLCDASGRVRAELRR